MKKEELEEILKKMMLKSEDADFNVFLEEINEIIKKLEPLKNLNLNCDDYLVTPLFLFNSYDEDEVEKVNEKEILKTLSHVENNYIIVPRVIE